MLLEKLLEDFSTSSRITSSKDTLDKSTSQEHIPFLYHTNIERRNPHVSRVWASSTATNILFVFNTPTRWPIRRNNFWVEPFTNVSGVITNIRIRFVVRSWSKRQNTRKWLEFPFYCLRNQLHYLHSKRCIIEKEGTVGSRALISSCCKSFFMTVSCLSLNEQWPVTVCRQLWRVSSLFSMG